MMRPTYDRLDRLAREGGCRGVFQGTYLHPNPRFYKYYWRVFSHESPVEDGAFFEDPDQRLSGHEMKQLTTRLEEEGKPFIYYNQRVPRRDPSAPWDPDHPRFRETGWAPAYDEDPDPPYHGEHR